MEPDIDQDVYGAVRTSDLSGTRVAAVMIEAN